MRNLLVVGAAALVLGSLSSVVPATAGGPGMMYNPCKASSDGHQLQCGLNILVYTSGSGQKINQDKQSIDIKPNGSFKGLVQFESATNIKLGGTGGWQQIDQSQHLSAYKAENAWHSPVQTQDAQNWEFGGKNNDQFISQNNDLETNGTVKGLKQHQSAVNIAIGGSDNYQEINQNQSITYEGEPPKQECPQYGRCGNPT